MQTSRGKFDNLRRTPAEFTAPGFDGYGLCYLLPTRPAETASYSVSVRQVTALLDASFEPCLTAAPLRFANTSPPSGCVEDFHLQVAKHARHTIKRCESSKGGSPISVCWNWVPASHMRGQGGGREKARGK